MVVKTVIEMNLRFLIFIFLQLQIGFNQNEEPDFDYSGVTHQSITIGFGLRHIRVSHLVLGLHTLDYHTWSRARTH